MQEKLQVAGSRYTKVCKKGLCYVQKNSKYIL